MPNSAPQSAGSPSAARRHGWLLRAAFAAAVLFQVAALYLPQTPGGDPSAPGADKAMHVLIFALVMLTGRLAGYSATPLLIALVAHAGISELVQHRLLPSRSGDLLDVVADLAGIALGWYVASMITRRRLRQ